MNWLLLLTFFNGILYLTIVKLHFLFKEVSFAREESSETYRLKALNLKI